MVGVNLLVAGGKSANLHGTMRKGCRIDAGLFASQRLHTPHDPMIGLTGFEGAKGLRRLVRRFCRCNRSLFRFVMVTRICVWHDADRGREGVSPIQFLNKNKQTAKALCLKNGRKLVVVNTQRRQQPKTATPPPPASIKPPTATQTTNPLSIRNHARFFAGRTLGRPAHREAGGEQGVGRPSVPQPGGLSG